MKRDKKALYESIMKIVAKEVKKALNESVDAQHPHQEWYSYCFDALQESINRGEIGSDDNIDDNIYALIEFVLPNIDELPSDPDDLSEEDYAELEYWLKEAWTNVEFDEEDNEEYNSFDICREILDHYGIEEDDSNWIGVSDIDEYLDEYYPDMPDDDRWFVHDRMEKFVNVDPYRSVRYEDDEEENWDEDDE